MPDIKAYSADKKVHVFPEGTDPGVIDRTMKRYAQTGGMEDPEAQAHQSLADKINEAPEARVGGPNSPKMSSNLQNQIDQVKNAPLSVGGEGIIDLAKSSGVRTAAKVAGRGLVGSMIGSYAGGHIGEFVGGETGKDIGEVGGGLYGGYKGVKGAEYKLPSWLGHFNTPEPPPYEPYGGGAGKLIERVRGGGGEPQFGRPGVDLQRGKVSAVPSAVAVESTPAAHEPYGGGSAARERLATRVRGRGEAGTPQYGRPGVDLQRGGVSPVPESPREPAQGRPRGFKRDKPASTGGLPSKPRTPSMQKLVDRIQELKGEGGGLTPKKRGGTLGGGGGGKTLKGKVDMYPNPNNLDAGIGSFPDEPVKRPYGYGQKKGMKLYHGTSESNANSILREGLDPNKIDPEYRNEEGGPMSFLGRDPETAREFAGEKGTVLEVNPPPDQRRKLLYKRGEFVRSKQPVQPWNIKKVDNTYPDQPTLKDKVTKIHTLYHGTTEEAANSIKTNGIRPEVREPSNPRVRNKSYIKIVKRGRR